jgi:LPS sulfotransferase NodH
MISDAYDRPTEGPAAGIKRLVVCTSPRTAGHTLCDALRRAGWGVPTEYFFHYFAVPLQRRWLNCDTDASTMRTLAKPYGDKLLGLRAPNRIFAAKIFLTEYAFMRDALGEDDGNWFYIYLHRNDRASQVISMLTARMTKHTFDGDYEDVPLTALPSVDDGGVRQAFTWLVMQERLWKDQLLRVDSARFISVCTEDFVSDPLRILTAIAQRFNLPVPDDALDVTAIRGGRYRVDAEIKQELRRVHGALLAQLANEMT